MAECIATGGIGVPSRADGTYLRRLMSYRDDLKIREAQERARRL